MRCHQQQGARPSQARYPSRCSLCSQKHQPGSLSRAVLPVSARFRLPGNTASTVEERCRVAARPAEPYNPICLKRAFAASVANYCANAYNSLSGFSRTERERARVRRARIARNKMGVFLKGIIKRGPINTSPDQRSRDISYFIHSVVSLLLSENCQHLQ